MSVLKLSVPFVLLMMQCVGT